MSESTASGGAPVGPRTESDLITIEDFSRVNLQVAKVLQAEAIAGATKLLKILVDLGGEERQIVAGIAEAYQPEALVGKSIILVTNLKPARLRGVDSNGMLLAATPAGGKPVLATLEQEVPPGTKVK